LHSVQYDDHVQDYVSVADQISADIESGRLRPGDRLLPQREFAAQRGIAASTAGRVYAELVRRGLVAGEVGRGTFVRSRPEGLPAEGTGEALVNLAYNFPVLPSQHVALAESTARVLRPEPMSAAIRPVTPAGTAAAREHAADLVGRAGWRPRPASVLFAGSGKQAIAAAIAALVPPGGRLGVEALTYPLVQGIAARLGVHLVPVSQDEDGVTPAGLLAAHRKSSFHAVYLQPTLHNPLGMTMPPARRAEIAALLTSLQVCAIEDAVYAFLAEGVAPLVSLAPDRTVFIDSLSKRVAPGLTVGYAVVPAGLAEPVAAAIASGGWTAGGFALAAATAWIADGTADSLTRAKRADAAARQEIAADRLAGMAVRADPASYHCWWELPRRWRADTFVAAAARLGIALTPAAAFAVGPGQAPSAVRLALASPPLPVLASALDALAALARSTPGQALGE
jgi:DNA-binding transcriptional MocR family regulator